MKTERERIDAFLGSASFAVAGVSRNKNKFGSVIFRELKARGLKIYPLNPAMDEVEGEKCYPSARDLPEKVEGLISVVSPSAAAKVAKDAWEAGIEKIWFQQGSQSDEALEFCREKGLTVVAKECIFMYYEPVTSFHRFHRGIAKLFGKYHKA